VNGSTLLQPAVAFKSVADLARGVGLGEKPPRNLGVGEFYDEDAVPNIDVVGGIG
jgi:hypothetical protein